MAPAPSRPEGPPPLTAGEFAELYRDLARRAAWAAGPRGALDALTPDRVTAAAREVRLGRSVSLAAPIEYARGPDNPEPVGHTMLGPAAEGTADTGDTARGLDFARDRFTMTVHGDVDSHLDALCHVIYDGTLHGGVPAGTVTADGAAALSVETVRDGIVGRGVLLDIPRSRGVPWLEPGDHVTAEDLAAAETGQQVRV
ncbi:MAG TPA: cyclase family protein, partial [Streptomyces sp.]